MGQQQLLLLVLATVIVGLATVAGIQAFEQGSVRANQDALTQTAVKIASDIQSQVQEPSQFGGYDGNLTSSDGTPNAVGSITLGELGYETSSNVYETTDGECAITTGGSNSASPSNGSEVTASSSNSNIVVTCASPDNDVSVHIDGLDSNGLTTVSKTTAS